MQTIVEKELLKGASSLQQFVVPNGITIGSPQEENIS